MLRCFAVLLAPLSSVHRLRTSKRQPEFRLELQPKPPPPSAIHLWSGECFNNQTWQPCSSHPLCLRCRFINNLIQKCPLLGSSRSSSPASQVVPGILKSLLGARLRSCNFAGDLFALPLRRRRRRTKKYMCHWMAPLWCSSDDHIEPHHQSEEERFGWPEPAL